MASKKKLCIVCGKEIRYDYTDVCEDCMFDNIQIKEIKETKEPDKEKPSTT